MFFTKLTQSDINAIFNIYVCILCNYIIQMNCVFNILFVSIYRNHPQAYVVPAFEVVKGHQPPDYPKNKGALMKNLAENKLQPFL